MDYLVQSPHRGRDISRQEAEAQTRYTGGTVVLQFFDFVANSEGLTLECLAFETRNPKLETPLSALPPRRSRASRLLLAHRWLDQDREPWERKAAGSIVDHVHLA